MEENNVLISKYSEIVLVLVVRGVHSNKNIGCYFMSLSVVHQSV